MALATQYPGYISIAEDPQNIIFGTCQIGQEYGEVKSASVKRTSDKEELANCHGALKAAILKNPRFELTIESLFTADVQPPGIGERIAFPLVGVIGYILNVDVKWEEAGARMLSIAATSWDSLEGVQAQHFDGAAWSPVVDTVAVSSATAPELLSATINAAGTVLTLVFDQAVTTPVITTGVSLTGSVSGTDTVLYASGNGTSALVYNLQDTISTGETVLLDYVQPGDGIQGLTGIDLPSIAGAAVTNNSTAP